jgi:hypothetical protein
MLLVLKLGQFLFEVVMLLTLIPRCCFLLASNLQFLFVGKVVVCGIVFIADRYCSCNMHAVTLFRSEVYYKTVFTLTCRGLIAACSCELSYRQQTL